ncbi:hypothetical protein M9Y10_020927 [Tritrichomonas musculus]|uniref:Surface antigen BspA-like n=1 Tax=Tritrichomonas musculus TaxID=1915356 RepID=A0ABR2HFW2_9EUKA
MKTIGNYAFFGCESLIEIKIPSVTIIGSYVFKQCSSLNQITIPSSLQKKNLGINLDA